jgi:ADP-ribose pyrophosphatase
MADDVKLHSERIWTGKVFNFDVDRIRYPNGNEADFAVVRHPGASAVIPYLSEPSAGDPQILLLRQYRYASSGYLYEIPAGRLDPGESPLQCARRELREETGCEAARMEEMCVMYMSPGYTDEKIHFFLAAGITRGEPAQEEDEFAEPVVLLLSRALAMIEQGEIQDAKTALAILFSAGFRAGL